MWKETQILLTLSFYGVLSEFSLSLDEMSREVNPVNLGFIPGGGDTAIIVLVLLVSAVCFIIILGMVIGCCCSKMAHDTERRFHM